MKTNIRKSSKNNNKIFGGKISMKNNIKKTLSIILAIITIFSITSITSFATEELNWTVATQEMLVLSEDGTTITGYTDKLSGNIEIPDKIDGTVIIKIANKAFENCESLTNVKIPQKIQTIGYYAFRNCSNLEMIYLNATGCKINAYTNSNNYAGCNKLIKFIFGENVTAIPANACWGAVKLQTVEFKNIVTSIGHSAFRDCSSLTGVDLSNVTKIDDYAFNGCTAIESVEFSENLKTIGNSSFEGCSMTEITIPEKVKSIGYYAFRNCANLKTVWFNATNCEVNDYTNGNNYEGCNNLTKLVFGEGVTSIPESVCAQADTLKTVEFNGIVETVGDYAFSDCSSLETVKYAGTEKDKEEIIFGKNNDYLINATWTCKEEEKPVEPVELIDAKSITINYKGSISIGKADLKNIDVSYESSSPEIISVDENGTITAVGTGTATITATATVNGEVIEDEVTVTAAYTWWQLIINIFLFGWLWY